MTILSYLRLARALFHSRMMEREEKGHRSDRGAAGFELWAGADFLSYSCCGRQSCRRKKR